MKVTISDEAELKELAINMIGQAVRDLNNKRDPLKSLDALDWLAGPDFEIWTEIAGADHLNPFKMLSIGGARKVKG